jgi:hypothetical protein
MQRAEQAEDEADPGNQRKQECSETNPETMETHALIHLMDDVQKLLVFEEVSSDPPSAYLTERRPGKNRGWYLPILEALQEREDRALVRNAAVADIPKKALEKEREWLTEHMKIFPPKNFSQSMVWKRYDTIV